MSRRKVTYRPSKAGSVMGGVVGCIFVLIGLFVIIPQFSMAGGFALLFGIAWTAIAAIMTFTNSAENMADLQSCIISLACLLIGCIVAVVASYFDISKEA